MLQLRKITTSQNRLPAGVFLLAWIVIMYYLPNKYLLFKPTEVPLSPVDVFVGTSSTWVWVYVSYYFYLATAYLWVKDENNLNQIFYSFLVSAFISTLIFFLLPSSLDRSLYPLGDHNSISNWMLHNVRGVDESLNCAPSMHVAMSTIAAFSFYKESKKIGVFTFVWALLIAYSTMATKQHYFFDVVTGFFFGAATFAFFTRAQYSAEAPIFSSKIASN